MPPLDSINIAKNFTRGKNFAPLDALTRAKKSANDARENSSDLAAFLRECWQEAKREHEETRREHTENGRIINNLMAGKLVMKRDTTGSGFVFLKPLAANGSNISGSGGSGSGGGDRSNYPLFPQNAETLKAKWAKTRKMRLAARSYGDGYRAEIQRELINATVNSYLQDIFTGAHELNEAISALSFGTYASRFYLDNQLNRMYEIAPIVQNQSKVMLDGYAACKGCGFETSDPKDFEKTGAPYPQCPECGSFKTTKMLEPRMVDEAQVVDYEEISQGDITGGLVHIPALGWDIRHLVQDSSYQTYEQFVPLNFVREMYGNLEIECESDTDNYALRVMDSLTARTGSIPGHGESDQFQYAAWARERAVMCEMWLKPEWYAGFKLKKPEKTPAGVIPADVDFSVLFPERLSAVGFNDMRFITGVYGNEKPRIVSGVYFLQAFSGLGKGVDDAVGVAQDLNEIHSMAMAGLKRYGAAGVFYDKSTLSLQDVQNLFKPQKAVPVDLAKNPHIQRIDQAVGQIQAPAVNDVLPTYSVQLSNLLNMAFMTGDFTQGMTQDVDINTFGGQQLAHAKAEEQKSGIITMKALTRELAGEEIFELFKENIKIPKWFASTASDRHARVRGKYVSGADFTNAAKVKFDVVEGTAEPQNSFEKRIAATEMIAQAGGLVGLIEAVQVNPRITGWFASQYGTEIPTLDENDLRLACLDRVDNIVEMANMFPDPLYILANLRKPLAMDESAHILKAEFLGQMLDDDEFAEMNPVARAAVQMLIRRHYELQAASMADKAMIAQGATQAVQAQANQFAQQQAQPMIDQQKQQADEQMMTGALMEAGKAVIDEAGKEADHERQNERDELNHQRAKELETVKAQNRPQQKSSTKK